MIVFIMICKIKAIFGYISTGFKIIHIKKSMARSITRVYM